MKQHKLWISVLAAIIVIVGIAYLALFYPGSQRPVSTNVSDSTTASWNLAEAAKPFRGKTLRLIGEDYPPLQAIKKMKGDFEEMTGITVEIEGYEGEAVQQKIAFDLTSGTGRYDLIIQVYFDMGRLAAQKQLRPFAQFVSNSRIHNPAFDPDKDLFSLWKTMGQFNGTTYGYPMMVLTMYTWYREDLLEDPTEKQAFKAKYGYELATPQDWRQYRDIAEFFTRPDQGLYGTLIQGKKHIALWQEYINFLYSFGGAIMDTNDPSKYGPIVINSPKAIAATEFYKSLLKYSPPDSLNFTWDDALALMQQGKVAICIMWNDSTYALENPAESKVAGKMGFAMMPQGDAGRIHQIGGQSYYIPATSKNPEPAYLFVEWMLQADNQIRQQLLGGSSARKSTYADPEVAKLPWTATSMAALEHTHPAMLYTFPEALQIGEVIKSSISDALSGRSSVRAALDQAALEIKGLVGDKAELRYPPSGG